MLKAQQQQIQLNLNRNQLLGNNLCQLFANQGKSLTTVPVNVSQCTTNGQTALISVITQVGSQTHNNTIPVQTINTINIDGTNTTAIQINNATTLNDLCTYVANANCPTNSNNELNVSNSGHNLDDQNQKDEQHTDDSYQQFTTLNQANPTNLQSHADTLELSINSLLNSEEKSSHNDSLSKVINHDDKSISGFSNLLDISLSDTIFNDTSSLQFPDVSIDSNFGSTATKDQTLNTPIKLPIQKSSNTINHHSTSSFTSQFNLFDSNLGGHSLCSNNTNSSNRNETTFSDSWIINNLASDMSLGNIFDCTNEQANFKSYESTSFKDKKDELFNTDLECVLNVSVTFRIYLNFLRLKINYSSLFNRRIDFKVILKRTHQNKTVVYTILFKKIQTGNLID